STLVILFVFEFLLGAFSSRALAQANANNQKVAEQHYEKASKLYAAKDYENAVKEFIAAYQAVPANPLLFNIGQAYRLSGDKEKALAYYQKYVAFEPTGAQANEAKEYIKELSIDVESQQKQQEAEAQARAQAEADAQAKAKVDAERRRKENERKLA